MIGEKLFFAIYSLQQNLIGKITGMMLQMGNNELLTILESGSELKDVVEEAVRVLEDCTASEHFTAEEPPPQPYHSGPLQHVPPGPPAKCHTCQLEEARKGL